MVSEVRHAWKCWSLLAVKRRENYKAPDYQGSTKFIDSSPVRFIDNIISVNFIIKCHSFELLELKIS